MIIKLFSTNNIAKHSVEKVGFFLLLFLSLAIIIIPKYYITGDGPSHIYNAIVFIDYFLGINREFYKPFYEINRNLDPNWTSQLLLGLLSKVFPFWMVDKVFQISYVCVFAFGFRKLITTIQTNNTTISLLFYPFCFTIPFQMGFYNYSLAIGILFLVLAYFIRNRNNWTCIHQLVFTLSLLLLSFTHGMVASHSILLCSLFILIDAYKNYKHNKQLLPIINKAISIIICMLPAVLIILSFAMRQGLLTSPHPLTIVQKFSNLIRLYCCQSTMLLENVPAIIFGIGILIIIGIIGYSSKARKNNICIDYVSRNVFIIFSIYSLVGYLNAPNTIGYAGGTDIRFAFLPPLFLLLACSTYSLSHYFKNGIALFGIIITITFLTIRFGNVISASKEIEKTLNIGKSILPNSIVMQIQFNTHGCENQMELDNSFIHVFDYVGAMKNKNIIILNNYEADLNYFSLHWRANKNPRSYMPNIINGNPPLPLEIINYEKATSHKINYIIWQDDVRKTKFKNKNQSNINDLKQYIIYQYDCIDSIKEQGIKLFARKKETHLNYQ